MRKMKQRDVKYAAERVAAFTTEVGRRYFRELSVDELPGNTTSERLAICLCTHHHHHNHHHNSLDIRILTFVAITPPPFVLWPLIVTSVIT